MVDGLAGAPRACWAVVRDASLVVWQWGVRLSLRGDGMILPGMIIKLARYALGGANYIFCLAKVVMHVVAGAQNFTLARTLL